MNHPVTPDGRYFVVRGRLWRRADPALPAARRDALVHDLMNAQPVLTCCVMQGGTGVLTEGQETKGMSATDVIYDDADFEQVANIKPTAFHRVVDLEVFKADSEGTL